MSILEKLKEDFLPKVQDRKSVTYTHADGEVTEIFFNSAANVSQTDKYLSKLSENKIEGYVELLIARAYDKTGGKMFAPKDKPLLMREVDPEFLTEVGNAILGVDEESAQEIEKETREIQKK